MVSSCNASGPPLSPFTYLGFASLVGRAARELISAAAAVPCGNAGGSLQSYKQTAKKQENYST